MSLSLPQRYDRDLRHIRSRIDQRHARAEFGPDTAEPSIASILTTLETRLAKRLKRANPEEQDDIYEDWRLAQELRRRFGCEETADQRPLHIHGLDCGFPATCGFVGLEPEGEIIHLPRPNGVAANGDRTWAADCGEPVVVDAPAREEFIPWQNWEC